MAVKHTILISEIKIRFDSECIYLKTSKLEFSIGTLIILAMFNVTELSSLLCINRSKVNRSCSIIQLSIDRLIDRRLFKYCVIYKINMKIRESIIVIKSREKDETYEIID